MKIWSIEVSDSDPDSGGSTYYSVLADTIHQALDKFEDKHPLLAQNIEGITVRNDDEIIL